MGARRTAACLCTARVLREARAPGGHPRARAGLCGILVSTSGGDLVGTWRGEPTVKSSMVGWCSCCDPVYGTTLFVLWAQELRMTSACCPYPLRRDGACCRRGAAGGSHVARYHVGFATAGGCWHRPIGSADHLGEQESV